MNIDKKNRILLGSALIIICLLSSCVYDTIVDARFRNCTSDTLFIGVSRYDNIDSVKSLATPHYNLDANSNVNITGISLWKGEDIRSDYFVYPDSLCSEYYYYLFEKADTGYFFLVKLEDAKRYSWDEIRTKKLYHKWIVVRNKEGEYNRNIRYDNSVR